MSESPSSAMRVHSEDGLDPNGGGADGSNKPKTLNRTSRACNNCRKQKMRCIGAEDPPCKRCRNGGLECLFEKPAREGTQVGEERIRQLETQVGSIQSTLAELVSTLKAANSANGIGPDSAPARSGSSQAHHPPSQQPQPRAVDPFGNSPRFYNGSADPLPNMNNYEGSLISIISPSTHASGLPTTAPYRSQQPAFTIGTGGGPSSSSASSSLSRPLRTAPLSIPDNHPYPLPPPIPSRQASSASHPSGGFVPFQGMHSRAGAGGGGGGGADHISPRTDSSSQHSGSTHSSRHHAHGVAQHQHQQHAAALSGLLSGGNSSGRQQLPSNPGGGPSSGGGGSGSNNGGAGQGGASHSYANLLHQSLYPLQKHDRPTSSARTTPAGSEADENELLRAEELDFPTRSALEPLGAMGRLAQAALQDVPKEAPTPAGSGSADGAGGSAGGGGLDGLMLLAEGANHTPSGRSAGEPSASSTGAGGGTAGAEGGPARPGKRARFADVSDDDDVDGAAARRTREAILSAGTGLKESHIVGGPGMAGGFGGPPVGLNGRILDCIDAGVVSLEEGKMLFDIYWQGAFRFLPIYEPERDTFDELRRRSPFSISAMCFVGARIRDGGGTKTEAQIGLWYHVRRISQETLFKTTTRVEAIQATILVTGWNEYGWLLAGHAVRLAFELGCHTAFLRLARSGMGVGRSPKQIEEDRGLVIMARVWFCLYVIEHQMSYGTGRPPIVREDETIIRCREFLNHPLAIETDLRLIASVEIMSIRAPLHLQLYNLPEEEVVGPETLARLHQANLDFESWYKDWDSIFQARFGTESDIFFRQSLRIQKAYAQLFHNCTALREIRGPADVRQMLPEQRELAKMALRNAQECLDICLHADSYRWAFTYAVHYTHVCAAFAATLLIRLARIFPTELDLRQTARDVTELAKILSNVPAGRYARSIRLTLRSARRRKVMPPPSVPSSPSSRHAPLPAPFSPSSFINPANGLTQPTPIQSRNGSPVVATSGLPAPDVKIVVPDGADDESPPADFSMDFDWGYTADLLDKVGLTVPEGGDVPLWLHGSDIGSSQLPSSGMENFFLPSDLDFRLYSADDVSNGGTGVPPPGGGGGFPFAGEGEGTIW